MERNYCYICGNKVRAAGKGAWLCTACDQQFYDNPKPCVELAIFNERGELLLTKRAADPGKGRFDLPGGFIDSGETAEAALEREMAEELGLQAGDYTLPRYLFSFLFEYPWGKEVYTNLVLEFTATLNPGAVLRPADDVDAVEWVKPDAADDQRLVSSVYSDVISRVARSRT